MSTRIHKLLRVLAPLGAICALLFSMGGSWGTTSHVIAAPITQPSASPTSSSPTSSSPTSPTSSTSGKPNTAGVTTPSITTPSITTPSPSPAFKAVKKELDGKINLNTATEDQLMLLPTVGPSKAERIVTWRKKNGGFKRPADLRRVKGFGYRTFKRLEPFLDIKGETTLAAKR